MIHPSQEHLSTYICFPPVVPAAVWLRRPVFSHVPGSSWKAGSHILHLPRPFLRRFLRSGPVEDRCLQVDVAPEVFGRVKLVLNPEGSDNVLEIRSVRPIVSSRSFCPPEVADTRTIRLGRVSIWSPVEMAPPPSSSPPPTTFRLTPSASLSETPDQKS